MPKPMKERTGLRYGQLTVIAKIHIRGLGVGWKCLCDCGQETYVSGSNLETGNTASCGCLFVKTHTTHGKTKNRVYAIWKGMRRRCQSPKAIEYRNYGGRGISVCKRWEKFENFFEDMGDPPDGLTLERINNNGNYTPSNCCWAPYKDQLNNRRNNRVIEAFGRKQTITQWAEELKIPLSTIRNRLDRAKLSPEEALRKKD